ncbi:MAG: LEA type 2 family protein [Treponema sp.]|nr:LEA type 2 family protein [Treponema sp.]
MSLQKTAPCLFLVILGFFAGCKTMSKLVSEPEISFNSVSVRSLSFTGAAMLAKVNVVNNNSFSIPFPKVDWELFILNNSLVTGTITNDTKIAAKSAAVVDIPFSVSYEELYKTIAALSNAGEVPYTVNVDVRFPVPVIENKTFSAGFSGVIPLLKMPSLSFDGIRFTSLGLSKVEFVLTWAVENKNTFPLSIDSLVYDFAVNGSSWANGRMPKGLNLAAQKTTQVPVTVSINSLAIIRDIVALAGSGRSVSFTCAGEAALNPSFGGLDAFAIPFNFTGTTNFGN